MQKILIPIFVILLTLFDFDLHAINLPTIHVIGDSHTKEFAQVQGCIIHWIGPVTMHRIGRDGISFLNLKNLGIQENQIAIFSFGEIDVRCHIGKQCDHYNRSLDEIIETLVQNYIQTVLLNRQLYHNLTCIIYSVTPPTGPDSQTFNYLYPHYGSLEDRINISKKLNTRLSSACKDTGVPFLNVYDDYALDDGSLNPALSDGNVHINDSLNIPIVQKLAQILEEWQTSSS